jgi:hypothetical protein
LVDRYRRFAGVFASIFRVKGSIELGSNTEKGKEDPGCGRKCPEMSDMARKRKNIIGEKRG